ncbi:MAG: acyl--CoA ligase [Steroidobacteraceae bacterium]|nr:acyl--CoA ligase [Steroidobacteraceae bacterium]MDW8257860.1 class I adenylate-forming enzyme family protein [Gammaproteobacteria bacterium]
MHVALLLEMAAEGMAQRTALGSVGKGLTFGALLQAARRTAKAMHRRPVRHVVWLGLNAPEFAVTLFGAALAGRPFVPLNYRLTDAQLRELLRRTAPSLLIVDDDMSRRVATPIAGVEVVTRGAFAAESAGESDEPPAAPDPDNIAILLFTSGTTGQPKAAILRHRHLTSYVLSTVEFMGAREDEAALISVPPYHIAAVSAVLTSTYSGRRCVQLPAFAPDAWLALVRRENITHAMVVPTMLGRILDELERVGAGVPSLQHLAYGGGPMPIATIQRALSLLPSVQFVNAYGLTETSSTIAILSPEDHRVAAASNDPEIRARLGSVGRPLPTIELQIRDAAGCIVPTGVEGDIWVRGTQIAGEYLDRVAVGSDGWFPTNDRGRLDRDGYLYLAGRADDVIVRGGENISPGEIEDVLREHPAVRDAAVIGVPDTEWGERIVAVVVAEPNPDPEILRDWVRSRLRSTHTPQQIVFVEQLPYSETGKLLRRTIRSELTGTGA